MYIVGLAGPPGSGKSTLAAEIAATTGAALAPMDGFHLTNAELSARGLTERKGAPETFDRTGYVRALRSLRAGEKVCWPLYDRAQHDPVTGPEIGGDFIITEGNYLLLWPEVRPLLDTCIFLEAPTDVIGDRLLARHLVGGKSSEAAARNVEQDLRNARLINETAHLADLVLHR